MHVLHSPTTLHRTTILGCSIAYSMPKQQSSFHISIIIQIKNGMLQLNKLVELRKSIRLLNKVVNIFMITPITLMTILNITLHAA